MLKFIDKIRAKIYMLQVAIQMGKSVSWVRKRTQEAIDEAWLGFSFSGKAESAGKVLPEKPSAERLVAHMVKTGTEHSHKRNLAG